jgi:acetyltransferase-like isoleucine patch superfamily enzyme
MKELIFKSLRNSLSDCFQRMRIGCLRFVGVQIGERTFISFGAWIDVARGVVRIGNGCEITKGCKILSHSAVEHALHPGVASQGGCTVIEDSVFIGMNAIILSNVKVGSNSIVGAGAVVTKNVPPYSVVAGNPARVIKRFDKATNVWCRVADDEQNSRPTIAASEGENSGTNPESNAAGNSDKMLK